MGVSIWLGIAVLAQIGRQCIGQTRTPLSERAQECFDAGRSTSVRSTCCGNALSCGHSHLASVFAPLGSYYTVAEWNSSTTCQDLRQLCLEPPGVNSPGYDCAFAGPLCEIVKGESPTQSPLTSDPTLSPTAAPTVAPTQSPTISAPTRGPSANPTTRPTSAIPTVTPTAHPTANPTVHPTANPTASPTANPTAIPTTSEPTVSPSPNPTAQPTQGPTRTPSTSPSSRRPTRFWETFSPTREPTEVPSSQPSTFPSVMPTSLTPTQPPTASEPTASPTALPTSSSPTAAPSTPGPTTSQPTEAPTAPDPTAVPTKSPSRSPTKSAAPTSVPTRAPTLSCPAATPNSPGAQRRARYSCLQNLAGHLMEDAGGGSPCAVLSDALGPGVCGAAISNAGSNVSEQCGNGDRRPPDDSLGSGDDGRGFTKPCQQSCCRQAMGHMIREMHALLQADLAGADASAIRALGEMVDLYNSPASRGAVLGMMPILGSDGILASFVSGVALTGVQLGYGGHGRYEADAPDGSFQRAQERIANLVSLADPPSTRSASAAAAGADVYIQPSIPLYQAAVAYERVGALDTYWNRTIELNESWVALDSAMFAGVTVRPSAAVPTTPDGHVAITVSAFMSCPATNTVYGMPSDAVLLPSVVSINVANRGRTANASLRLMSPITVSFTNVSRASTGLQPRCVYFDNSLGGGWKSDGCTTQVTASAVECSCNHLTDFSVLFTSSDSSRSTNTPSPEAIEGLEAISAVGMALGLLGCLVTLITFAVHPDLVNMPQKIIASLLATIGALFVVFLAGVEPETHTSPGSCKFVAVLLHYLILSSWAWMLCEGMHMYGRFVAVFGTDRPFWQYATFGWLLPLSVIAMSAGAFGDDYGPSEGIDACWIRPGTGAMYLLLCPLVLLLCFSIAIFVRVVPAVLGHRDSSQPLKLRARAFITFASALGFTYIFAFLVFYDGSIVWRFLFVLASTTQAAVIWYYHVWRRPDFRRRIRQSSVFSPKTISKTQTQTRSSVGLGDTWRRDVMAQASALSMQKSDADLEAEAGVTANKLAALWPKLADAGDLCAMVAAATEVFIPGVAVSDVEYLMSGITFPHPVHFFVLMCGEADGADSFDSTMNTFVEASRQDAAAADAAAAAAFLQDLDEDSQDFEAWKASRLAAEAEGYLVLAADDADKNDDEGEGGVTDALARKPAPPPTKDWGHVYRATFEKGDSGALGLDINSLNAGVPTGTYVTGAAYGLPAHCGLEAAGLSVDDGLRIKQINGVHLFHDRKAAVYSQVMASSSLEVEFVKDPKGFTVIQSSTVLDFGFGTIAAAAAVAREVGAIEDDVDSDPPSDEDDVIAFPDAVFDRSSSPGADSDEGMDSLGGGGGLSGGEKLLRLAQVAQFETPASAPAARAHRVRVADHESLAAPGTELGELEVFGFKL